MRIKQYIKRTYRILPEHDKVIKKYSKKLKVSESEVVRKFVEYTSTGIEFDK